VDGLPARAMRRHDDTDVQLGQRRNGLADDRLEQGTREVQPADEPGDPLFARQALRVPQDVDGARMRAAGDDDEALAANVDDDVLVVPDHRIRLPAALSTGVVDREAPFEARRALDLARDKDGPIDADGWSLLLDDRQTLGLEV